MSAERFEGLYSIEGFNSEHGQGRNGYNLTITLAPRAVEAILKAGTRPEDSPLYTGCPHRQAGFL